MPKQLLKRFFPNPKTVQQHPSLQFLGPFLHEPNLWHLNRRSVSRAFLVGVFFAFMPMPFQMVAAAILGVMIHSNLPISIGLVWISNPITIPPIFYFTYKVGTVILDTPIREFEIELSLDWVLTELGAIWQPLLLGSLICAIIFSAISFIGIRLFWRFHVVSNWNKRKAKRLAQKTNH
ncbi:DUF2062 domain-containing protein [Bermanella sp. WJH001]|uniref:DUF2062 domain-containing protein n=1 Tax=Bermanella sp. WJH001 TaxID=3048005 RepID=UPI0024BEF20F|nr:DUF2062 domain-containing protein [Bermanella sp. WJH001]MDJ1537189.1 DUF2062 domain-containing protein [Bermanella sp. WJH001]